MRNRKARPTQHQEVLPGILYDQRFLESHAGSQILHDPKTAVVELIANAWDAGATEVHIVWPEEEGNRHFSISDNGVGMTDTEFQRRWRMLSYNRPVEQGMVVRFPDDLAPANPERVAFGRNGIGRWAGFCFGVEYFVDTCKEGLRNRYRVRKGSSEPFAIDTIVSDETVDHHGTSVECRICRSVALSPEDARSEIGMRFLTDPYFRVSVNNHAVDFSDINDPNIKRQTLHVGNGNTVELIIIDTQVTDRTTKQHGVAWHVGGRLVGSCNWRGAVTDDLIDGRRIAAKRFTFIVRADFLAEGDAIKKDWSGFDKDNDEFQQAAQVVHEKVREYLLTVSEDDRRQTLAKARARSSDALKMMGPLQREKWTDFVNRAQEACPSIKESEILKLSEILANLEQARSGYAILHKLGTLRPDQWDDLDRLLGEWTIDMAKVVLDEIGRRLRLVEELRVRTIDKNTKEVQELQPLFEKGLWIFGPEFETIEYTSNETMTRVVQELFKVEGVVGSRNRPDFVVLPDGTSGLYAYPTYDNEGGEIGTDRLVVVELKRPGISIGNRQKNQCWEYVKELYSKGLLQQGTQVTCFVLGSSVEAGENFEDKKKNDRVVIKPMLFDTVLTRAKSRLLTLCDRVKNAPFLKEHRKELEVFLAPLADREGPDLFEVSGARVGQ